MHSLHICAYKMHLEKKERTTKETAKQILSSKEFTVGVISTFAMAGQNGTMYRTPHCIHAFTICLPAPPAHQSGRTFLNSTQRSTAHTHTHARMPQNYMTKDGQKRIVRHCDKYITFHIEITFLAAPPKINQTKKKKHKILSKSNLFHSNNQPTTERTICIRIPCRLLLFAEIIFHVGIYSADISRSPRPPP